MGSFVNFLGGLIVGAAVGVGVVVFTTPKTGDETRSDLTALWNNALDTGKRAAKEREEQLWTEFNINVRAQSDGVATGPTQFGVSDQPRLTTEA